MTRRGRDPSWWLGAAMVVTASAGAAYYLDPQRGHRCRATGGPVRVGTNSPHARRLRAYFGMRYLTQGG